MDLNRNRRQRWTAAAACAVAGVVVFHCFGNATRGYLDTTSVFWWWSRQWFLPGAETEHGPLILLLAGWLWWRNLRRAPRGDAANDSLGPGAGSERGLALGTMGVGLALHALGYMVQQTRLSIAALLLFSWGVLWLGGGRRWARAAVFPLLLMLFAVPVGFLETAGFHLRLAVIATTEVLARAAGLDVIRNGTQLFAPDGRYQYDVAAACSGVRSLLALLALSLLIGYLQLRAWWRRLAVFLLAFPLTFVGNVVRIAAVVFAGEGLGQRAGEWVHAWAGFVVFVIVLGGVYLAARRLARDEDAVSPPSPEAAARTSLPPSAARAWTMRMPLMATVVILLLLASGTAAFTVLVDRRLQPAGAGVALNAAGAPAELPGFIGTEWIGQATAVTAIERDVLPADTGFSRRMYVSTQDRRRQVFLSIVLSGRDRTSIHRPELCLVGQGWTIVGQSQTTFDHPQGGWVPAALLQLQREVVTPSGERQVVPAIFAYWFVGRDSLAASTGARMWSTALNRLRLRPDRWAYVVAQTLVLPRETPRDALARVQEVLDGTLPSFQPLAGVGAGER